MNDPTTPPLNTHDTQNPFTEHQRYVDSVRLTRADRKAQEHALSLRDIHTPSQLSQTPADPQAMILEYLAKNPGLIEALKSQNPSSGGIHIHIRDSFNQTNSHNRYRRQHTEQTTQQPEKLSQLVPVVFAGFWLISIFVLIVSSFAGVNENGR